MRKEFLFLLGLALIVGAYVQFGTNPSQSGNQQELLESIDTLKSKVDTLEERVSKLESVPRPASPVAASHTLARVSGPQVPRVQGRPVEASGARIVDRPPPNHPSCIYATTNAVTKLARTLTWDPSIGGSYAGDLPAKSVVEILSSSLYIWNDYPDEHALYVKVIESPSAPQMEYQSGYIELRRINHKRCNLGAEFDK
jgi:hypothetical protein